MYEHYLTESRQRDDNVIADSLARLGGEDGPEPVGELRDLILSFCRHREAEIRQLALYAAAMRWQMLEAFQIVKEKLDGEEDDEEVLEVAISSLARFSRKAIVSSSEIDGLLLKVINDKKYTEDLRKVAYIDLLRMHDEITNQQYAKMGICLEKVTIDSALVDKYASHTNS